MSTWQLKKKVDIVKPKPAEPVPPEAPPAPKDLESQLADNLVIADRKNNDGDDFITISDDEEGKSKTELSYILVL